MNSEVLCPRCGTRSPGTAKFCLKCGQRLPDLPAEPQARPCRKRERRWWIWAAIAGGAIVLGLAVIAWIVIADQSGKEEVEKDTVPPPAHTATVVTSATGEPGATSSPASLPTTTTLVATISAAPTATPLPSATPLPTATPPPTATSVPTATPITPTPTPSPTTTPTPSLTPTRRPTAVPYCYVGKLERVEDYTFPLISIHGVVVDRRGKGVRGVRVRVSAFNWYHDVRTGRDGVFVIDGLAQAIEWTISLPENGGVLVKVPIEKPGQKGIVRFEEKPCP